MRNWFKMQLFFFSRREKQTTGDVLTTELDTLPRAVYAAKAVCQVGGCGRWWWLCVGRVVMKEGCQGQLYRWYGWRCHSVHGVWVVLE